MCWNAAGVLGRCLEHLLAQDHPNYEVVVVDDGSSDDSVAIAQEALGHGRLTVVRSPLNRGCPHARNLGLRHAAGDIVAFIDADGYAAPDWLCRVVAAFDGDPTIGAVASTVFFAGNPLVINGAGGTVNRQGWGADLLMNVPYGRGVIPSEALYPMGCGMALRRAAVDRVGPFDEHMLNYYDDVDYGMRLWRAGYRVVVAPDAWIDHDFGQTGGDTARKQLLCERHRMRVVLKHWPTDTLGRWFGHELRELRRASRPRRAVKLKALAWNVRHLPSVLTSRRRTRRAGTVPERLIDQSWGDGFPAGVPPISTPCPESAGRAVEMADPDSEGQLIYGWFPVESVAGRSYRWAADHAAALVSLPTAARRLRLDYAHVPEDLGGVDVHIRRAGSPDPLSSVWSTHLPWQYIARSVENHPLALPAGDYEVVFSARQGWPEPPLGARSLGLSLASMSFEESYELLAGGLDMASPAVEEQLVCGWFEAEQSPERSYRWAGRRAAVIVRVAEGASNVCVSYCLAPASIGGLTISICRLPDGQADGQAEWSTRIAWQDADWHEDSFPLSLAAGDYVVSFEAEATWSNPDGGDPSLWAENRSLGFALASLSFE